MEILEFVASLVKSLSWPIAVVIVAAIFRTSIAAVMRRFSRVKYKELEFEFKQELKSIATSLVSVTGGPAGECENVRANVAEVKTEIQAVAEVSPRAAIPLAWASVETELRQAVYRAAESSVDIPMFDVRRRLASLQQRGLLDVETAQSILRLRDLRDRAVHGDLALSAISERDAWDYAELAAAAIQKLRAVKK